MFIIPGQIITLLTFPSVIFHELRHKWFCRWTGVGVHEVCYFRFGSPARYVIHEKPEKFFRHFLSLWTHLLVVRLFACLVLDFLSWRLLSILGLKYFLVRLGGAIAINSFPSATDANSLWKETNDHIKSGFGAVVGYPFFLFIYVANILSFFWFDLIYASTLCGLVSMLLKTHM
jgi:hypothetical protein